MQSRRTLSRIIYGSIYLLFYLVLLGLLLITPGDAIDRSLRNGQTYNVWILTVAYVLTVVVVCFVYALRLYINKTALASIPKAWVPIEKGDVKNAVYEMIAAGLGRSAMIAYEACPRVEMGTREREQGSAPRPRSRLGLRKTKTAAAEELSMTLPPHRRRAVWGEIEHYGWASPNSPDLPNLQYSTVVSELPSLIEAKALTMAPADGASQMLDAEAAGLLQRSPDMSLRDYVDHLGDVGLVHGDKTTADFVSQYEYARFSNRPISNARFRELMHLFAEMLRAMQPLNLERALGSPSDSDDWAPSESDMDNDAPIDTDPPSRAGSTSTHASTTRPARGSRLRTAPHTDTPTSRRRAGILSRESSRSSFAQTRRPRSPSPPSSSSLRSKTSSSDAGSVIRLATREDPEALPYVLSPRAMAGS